MSSQLEEFLPLSPVKGSLMRTFIDHSKALESPEYNWVECNWDGKEDSDIFSVPNHWHKEHDEIMEVLEGKMIFWLEGKEIIQSAGDASLLIPKGRVHGFTTIKGQPVKFTERTKPAGDFKARFFQDLLQQGGLPGFLLMMRVAYDGDMYVPLPGGFKALDVLFITIFGLIARPFVPAKPKVLKRIDE